MAKQTDDNLITLLNRDEKIQLQTGRGCWNTAPIEKLGITSVTVADGPLGLNKTVDGQALPSVALPSAAKMACSFDVDVMRKYGAIVGEQCRAESVDMVLGPAVNIKRDPRCGRNFEYFSEDPLLTGQLAVSYIEGVTSQGVGVCVKHFAANNQEYGRYVCDSVIDDRALREIYLSAFERIVTQTNPCAVMCSYNKLNGEYCSQNRWLLTDVLRNEWGFKGLVMSDWGATDDRVLGIKAGLDLEMPQGDTRRVEAAVDSGELSAAELDAVVQRVVDLSKQFKEVSARAADLDSQREFARKISAECTVLVKNNCNLLPLSKKEKVAVIGALAETPVYQGDGSSRVKVNTADSFVAALRHANLDFDYANGYNLDGTCDETLIDRAVQVAQSCNKVILIVGDKPDEEARDRSRWTLPENQLRVIDAVTSANSEVVIVIQCGSSVDTSFAHAAKAMLIDYYGGERSGQALCDVIFGDIAPQGRLAETWYLNLPETANDFDKDYHRALYKESIFVGYRYTSTANVEVAFPFGYGLSYSNFKWATPTITHRDKTKITVTVAITNTGKYVDSEVVQVYSSNIDCRDFIERKKLIGFARVALKPREKKTVSIVIPTSELAHYDVDAGKFEINGGRYAITLGKNVCDERFTEEYVVNADNTTADRSEQHPCYYNLDEAFNPTDEQFVALYGKPLAEEGVTVTVSTPVGDLNRGIVAKLVKSTLTRNHFGEDRQYCLSLPLRNYVCDTLSLDMLLTIIDMLNGAVFKNLWKLFKQFLACKKARKHKKKV